MRVRALLALAIVALSLYVAVTVPARLGLDLRGGTQIVLETRDTPTATADSEATDRTLEVLRRRVDALGITEPTLTRSGDQRIIVELPGVQDPREAADVLGRTAQLAFHPVLGEAPPGATDEANKEKGGGKDNEGGKAGKPDKSDKGELVLPDEEGRPLRLGPSSLNGGEVAEAEARIEPQQGLGWFVSVDFHKGGKGKWADLTGEAACAAPGDPVRRVAIVLDDEVISSPQVDPGVQCGKGIAGGSTQITGDFDRKEARELALLINGGALPVPVEAVEQRTVGPTLGAAAIEASAQAAIIGTALTGLFIMAVYRLLGGLAVIALACYGVISYAALVGLGATLTLPGLAGFVLAIGMAVDANVLVFERAREEYATATRQRKTPRSALAAGFREALSAIADSNITTLIAAALLFLFASGPVRGFGVTLGIGVLASMVSALVITRALADLAVARRAVRRRPGITGIAHIGAVRTRLTRRDPDLMGRRRRWLAASAVAMVLATAGILVRGLDFGVEFTGGRLVEYATTKPVDVDRARDAVADAGFPRAVVQASGDGELTVRTGGMSNAEEARVGEAIGDLAGGEVEKVRDELIGPSMGEELRRGALIALAVAVGAQLLYLAVRFRFALGVSAVVAMVHDALIVVGAFAWMGKPIDGVFLAALLTVIGYSVNDSVVIFDRVRQLQASHPEQPYARTTNTALVQTVPRTVNTGMGAMCILATLALVGGDSLTDFALALLIGVAVGTYSSMFTAAPLAVELQARGMSTSRPSGGDGDAGDAGERERAGAAKARTRTRPGAGLSR
ncbi:protein translocase subunit SecD [Streptomyces sp. 71268]|uniref:protein translocase subunit SecD n=1 Tax=Streptomyces sp. 71268 TaxID=3002640 RepID=UPI0023F935DF|nr:protein translocase subunit SecD [Streptomyces sp. 71268]WEV29587.1 protein translocase subunit SecD [Streptomyces sp. 71268]